MRPRAWVMFGIWVGMISLGSGACRSFNDYCTDRIDCLRGNDADIEACEVDLKRAEDIASNHGCSEWFNALQDCLEEEESCRTVNDVKVWGVKDPSRDCFEEQQDYNGCMSK